MIHGRKFFDKPVKNYLPTFDNIKKKNTTDQGDHYTTGCILDYPDFKKCYKMIIINLSKQKNLMLIQKQYFFKYRT